MVKRIAAQITEQEDKAIDTLVERGCFINRSDFVRTAIREFLASFPSVEEATKRTGEKDE